MSGGFRFDQVDEGSRTVSLGPGLPKIPERLLLAHARGEVLFICGAGVSLSAGLPLFQDLVCAVYGVLDTAIHERLRNASYDEHDRLTLDFAGLTHRQTAEVKRFVHEDYDVVLGMLERRLDGDRRAHEHSKVRETREYIPIAILPPTVIASSKLQIIPGAPIHYFGVLTSAMHMSWMRTVAGRLKSDYSYSPSVYNSFPWPKMSDNQCRRIEELSQAILDTRAKFPDSPLDVLYDPDAMPPALRTAHLSLDRAVDRLYRRNGFASERERVEHLFSLHEKRQAPLLASKQGSNRSGQPRRQRT